MTKCCRNFSLEIINFCDFILCIVQLTFYCCSVNAFLALALLAQKRHDVISFRNHAASRLFSHSLLLASRDEVSVNLLLIA